jgi:peroxiredoxin
MKPIVTVLIGLIGALLGVTVVIAGLYLLFEYTNLAADPLASSVTPDNSLPPVVVTVNGEAITREMVEAEVKISRLNLNQPLPTLSGEDLALAQEEAINQLITRHLILQVAARQGYVLPDEMVRQHTDLLFGGYGPEVLQQALQEAGASQTDVEWWVREIFTVEGFTTEVIMAEAAPEARQQVYNDWLNLQRSTADIQFFTEGESQQLPAQIGEPAPEFTLLTTSGQTAALSDYRGQVVLVNFWATWCSACLAELPTYEQVYQKQGQNEFVVLGVNLQEEREQAAQYAAGLGLTFPILLDEDGQVTTRHYQATGMPASFIIDPQGNLFYRHLGPMSGQTLETRLAELGL